MDVAFALKWNSLMPQQPLEIRLHEDSSSIMLSRSNQDWKTILATPFNISPHPPLISWLQAFSDESILNVCKKCGTSEGEIGDCEVCDGGILTCEECDGDGNIDCNICDGEGDYTCGECDGEGDINVDCETCNGNGEIRVDCEECDNAIGEVGFVECEECDGTGEDDDGKQCKICEGEMQVKCEVCEGRGDLMETCEECGGSGEILEDCDYCDGGLVTCDECWGGQVNCQVCDGGEVDCEECGGEWEGDNCNEHQLLKDIINPQPQVQNLQNNLNDSNEKLKFKILSFKTNDGAKKFANNSNNFCYILTLRNGVGTRELRSDWRITVDTNLEFPANRLVDIYYIDEKFGYFTPIKSKQYLKRPSWDWSVGWKDEAVNLINMETTLVVRTNISLKEGNFLNWNTDSPWTS